MAAKNVLSMYAVKIVSRRSYCAVGASKQSPWAGDNIVTSPFKNVEVPKTTIVNYMWEKFDKWPNKTAVVCGITNRSFKYHELQKYSRNFASRLRSHFQINDGDVICAMMPNSPQYCVTVLGTLEAGAELTTMNPIYTAHEVQRQLQLSMPKIVVGTTNTAKVIKDALKLAKMDLPVIIIKMGNSNLPIGTIDFEELAIAGNVDHSILKQVNRNFEDVAVLPYSSGTTGLPKGVELLNKNLVANFVQTDGIPYFKEATDTYQDAVIAVLPFYHIYGLSIIMLHRLSLGAKLVTLPKFQPDTFLKALKDYKISTLPIVPPMVLFLGTHPESKKEHLEHVHTITCGAAPLPKNDIEKLLEKTNPTVNFSQIYGLTETSPLVTIDPPGSDDYCAAGIPIPNTELKIIADDHQSLGPNQVGELLIRGPQVMKGYRNNPDATKNSIDEDNWFHSGDLGAINEKGVLTIHDRLKELIKVKGYQVPPAELESVLKQHSGVLDVAVLGIPDKRMGEAPKAFIVLKDGQKPDSEEIKDFVKERVAEYKRLKEVVFVDSLPRNPSGKILKRVLKDQFS